LITKFGIEVPDNLKYSKDHEWAEVMPDGQIKVGITKQAVKLLNDLVFIDIPSAGKTVKAGESFGTIESVKAVSEVFAPVSGEIVKVNDAAVNDPTKVSGSTYGEGWLVIIKPSQADADMAKLLSAQDYAGMI